MRRFARFAAFAGFAMFRFVEPAAAQTPKVTFEQAIQQAVEKNPGVLRAAQAIEQAEALLQQSRTVYRPSIDGTVGTTIVNSERAFGDSVVQPQTQSAFGATISYPVLAPSRWAARAQAEDQIGVARLGVTEVRRQIAIAAAQAYLAVIAQQRQVEVNRLARDTGRAHSDYAKSRLDAGAGSRLDFLRASQELAVAEVLLEAAQLAHLRAQEALGVLMAAEGPVDAAGEPAFDVAAEAAADWITSRTDIRLLNARIAAADRVVRDSRKDWFPNVTASFTPQYVTPTGLFQPSRTWTGFIGLNVPIFDGGNRRAIAAQREIARDVARIELTETEIRAKSERRTAELSVASAERALASARKAAADATEVMNITGIAVREGAGTNLELVDAQRRAREAATAVAQAEDRLRQARLDLLVALGRFPG